jgi:hypothetical protein
MPQPSRGVTLLEVCVTLLLVGFVTGLTAVQMRRNETPLAGARPLIEIVHEARTAALRSGHTEFRVVTTAERRIEFSVLASGRVVADSGSLTDTVQATLHSSVDHAQR